MPQGPGIDGTEGQTAEWTTHIVQAVVTVDRADYRQTGGAPQQRAHHVGPGTMAVNQLVAARTDIRLELALQAGDIIPAHDLSWDTTAPSLFCKGTVPKADQLGGDGLV